MLRYRARLMILCFVLAYWLPAWAQETKVPPIPKFDKLDFAKLTTFPVMRVIDGDTIVVGNQERSIKVRLIGVDTPETKHPNKPVQYYGKEASRFTRNLLKGEQVYLVSDPSQGKTDRYGRTLAYVYRAPDGLFVNAEIIRQGYGHAYKRIPNSYLAAFTRLEAFARNAQKGLWESSSVGDAPKVQSGPAATTTDLPKTAASSKPSSPATNPEEQNITVYVTNSGKKYHRGSCRFLSKSRVPMKLVEAKGQYGPCGGCRPPK